LANASAQRCAGWFAAARPALLAALMLALTPIFVAMSRFNNPDPLLVLCELGAAWALVRALESGRTRHLLLCGLLVGLAFNVKMLAAYLIVPGLALAFVVAGKGRLRRRVAQLATGGAAMFAVSFAWYGAMMLVPATNRPFVGDTTDNSWFSLIFGANGLSRVAGGGGVGSGGVAGPAGAGGFGGGVGSGGVAGPAGAGGFGGAAGITRLFNPIVGGQIAWLLPLALLGLLLGLGVAAARLAPTRPAPPTSCGAAGVSFRGRSSASRQASSTPTTPPPSPPPWRCSPPAA
jgi:4-amino-4-deoxy-L-arabinose transferase-like glycosyltransferase